MFLCRPRSFPAPTVIVDPYIARHGPGCLVARDKVVLRLPTTSAFTRKGSSLLVELAGVVGILVLIRRLLLPAGGTPADRMLVRQQNIHRFQEMFTVLH